MRMLLRSIGWVLAVMCGCGQAAAAITPGPTGMMAGSYVQRGQLGTLTRTVMCSGCGIGGSIGGVKNQ